MVQSTFDPNGRLSSKMVGTHTAVNMVIDCDERQREVPAAVWQVVNRMLGVSPECEEAVMSSSTNNEGPSNGFSQLQTSSNLAAAARHLIGAETKIQKEPTDVRGLASHTHLRPVFISTEPEGAVGSSSTLVGPSCDQFPGLCHALDLTATTCTKALESTSRNPDTLPDQIVEPPLKESAIPRNSKRFYTADQVDWLISHCSVGLRLSGPGGWAEIEKDFKDKFGGNRASNALRTKFIKVTQSGREQAALKGKVGDDKEFCHGNHSGGQQAGGRASQAAEFRMVEPQQELAMEEEGEEEEEDKFEEYKHCEAEELQPLWLQAQGGENRTAHAVSVLQPMRDWLRENMHKFQDAHHEVDWEILADIVNNIFEVSVEANWLKLCWNTCVWEECGRRWG